MNGNDVFQGAGVIPRNQIQVGVEELGRGQFGRVLRGKCNGLEVAIKTSRSDAAFNNAQLQAFLKEVNIWSRCVHPNISLLLGAFVSPTEVLIVTELLGGDLQHLLIDVPGQQPKKRRFSLWSRLKMLKQACQGLAWLHNLNPKIIHRDIKTSNLLYSLPDYKIKLCDLGLSDLMPGIAIKDRERSRKGTLLYMAPDVIANVPFDTSVDVYSMSIVFWEVVKLQEPFLQYRDSATFARAIISGERPALAATDCPHSLATLMQSMWAANSRERPSITDVIARLDAVLVDSCVLDPEGNSFWKQSFFQSESTSFDHWAQAFYAYVGLELPVDLTMSEGIFTSASAFGVSDPDEYVPLANPNTVDLRMWQLLMSGGGASEDPVHICMFGKVLDCLGPLNPSFFDSTREVCSQPWFWGHVRDHIALDALKSSPDGGWLLRFDNSVELNRAFVLSKVKSNRRVVHIQIVRLPGQHAYQLHGNPNIYGSLIELIDMNREMLKLGMPAPGSQFHHLFLVENDDDDQMDIDDDVMGSTQVQKRKKEGN